MDCEAGAIAFDKVLVGAAGMPCICMDKYCLYFMIKLFIINSRLYIDRRACHRRQTECEGGDDDEVADWDDVDDGSADGGFGGGVDGRVSCRDGFCEGGFRDSDRSAGADAGR